MKKLFQFFGRITSYGLLFLFLCQSFVLLSVFFFGGIPVGSLVEKLTNSYLEDEAYYIKLGGISISLSGVIILDEFRLYEKASGGELLSLDRAKLATSLEEKFFVDFVNLAEVEISLPSIYSPTGVSEQFIHVKYLELLFQDNRVLFNKCSVESGGLDIQIEGEYAIDLSKSSSASNSASPKKDAGGFLKNLHEKLLAKKDVYAAASVYLSCINKGSLLIDTYVDENDKNYSNLFFSCESIRLNNSFSVAELRAQLEGLSLDSFDVYNRVDFTASDLSYKDFHVSSFYLKSKGKNSLYAGLIDIETPYEVLDSVYLNLSKEAPFILEGAISWMGEFNRGRGEIGFEDYKKGIGSVKLVANTQNLQLLSDYLTRFKVDFELKTEAFAFGEVFFKEGWKFDRVLFSADADAFSVNGLNGSMAHASGVVDRKYVHIENAFGFGDRFDVSGQYYQHYKKGDFFIKAQGEALPYELDGILHTWWDKIWKDFDLFGNRIDADVFVGGSWKDRSILTSFSRAQFVHASYKGVNLMNGDLSVFQRTGEVHVKGIDAELDEGFVKGDLHWYFPSQKKLLTYVDLYAKTRFRDLLKLSDEKQFDAISSFSFANSSLLGVNAIYSSDGDLKTYKIDSHFKSKGVSSVWGIPTKDIDCIMRAEPGKVEVLDISGELISGQASGDVLVDTEAEQIVIDLSVVNADFQGFSDALKQFSKLNEVEVDTNKKKEEKALIGKVDLDVDISGPYNSLLELKGEGHLEIKDTDLGRIHLLWGVSKLFDSVGLGFSSFAMNGVTSELRMLNQKLYFDALEIKGPKISIKGGGKFVFEGQSLDFDFNVFLMDAERLGLTKMFGFLLKPLGYALPIKLRGDIKNPRWRLGF